MRIFGIIAAAALLSACATKYGDMGLAGGVAAQQLTSDTAIISARGNGFSDATTIQMFALRKAAETTIAAGFESFMILEGQDRTSNATLVTGGAYSSQTTVTALPFSNMATANTTGSYTAPQLHNIVKPGQDLMIRMFNGETPPNARAFNARELLSYLAPPDAKKKSSGAARAAPAG